jgi:hypothetical protein
MQNVGPTSAIRKPVVVEGVDAEAGLELGAGRRVLRARLAPEAAQPELEDRGVDARLRKPLREMQPVARGREQHRRAHRLHELDLPVVGVVVPVGTTRHPSFAAASWQLMPATQRP